MNKSEIDEVREIRQQISRDHHHDVHEVAQACRRLEAELRVEGGWRFSERGACSPLVLPKAS
jgi:hypothetical protein